MSSLKKKKSQYFFTAETTFPAVKSFQECLEQKF